MPRKPPSTAGRRERLRDEKLSLESYESALVPHQYRAAHEFNLFMTSTLIYKNR